MPAKYIIRFDDICPTMNWEIWGKIEKILIRQKINPVLAIVPDNKDPTLMVESSRLEFWDLVRSWQARGWTIGVHGYQHTYVTDRAGLVGINGRSEFAGLSEQEQESKLENALAIFRREEIIPEVWVAPGHSFDSITLRLLKRLGLDVVNDGFHLSPKVDSLGITHIPQQLWRLRHMPFGLWTVCYHPNSWTSGDVDRFRSDVQRYRQRLTSLRDVLATYPTRNHDLTDALFFRVCLLALKTRSTIRRLIAHNQEPTTVRSDPQK